MLPGHKGYEVPLAQKSDRGTDNSRRAHQGYKKHGILKYDKITYAKGQDTDS
jgi:hypothetical protein